MARTAAVEVEVEGKQLRLSNLDKVLYPEVGFTKGQVIDYYTRIAPVLLPHLKNHPLTLKRYPNGVDEKYFYEKQAPSHRPDWVKTVPVPARGRTIDFVLCNDLPTLVWLANLADLELHTSLSLAKNIDQPSTLAFDLDPGPPATIVECAEVALLLRDMSARLLSGGEQQMLVLAQALVSKPRFILIDELSLGLAPVVVQRLIPTIRRVADSGVGVLLIEQFATVALGLANRVYVMERGRIQFSGQASELKERPDLLQSAYLPGGGAATATANGD